MKKKKSLVRHILVDNFRLTVIIISIILVVVFVMLCVISRENEITETKMQLSQSAQSIRLDMERNIERANYIAQNDDMINNLNKTFTDGYELMTFIKSFNMFMDSFDEANSIEREKYIVYVSNPSLVESKYFRQVTRLDNIDEIKNFYSDTGQVFYWHKEIEEDTYGNRYMLLYRVVPMEYDCIVEVKIYFEDSLKEVQGLNTEIKYKDNEPLDGDLTFSESLGNDFIITMKIDKDILHRRYFIYFLLCLLSGLVFLFSAMALAVWSVNRTMKDVLSFVKEVESGELSYAANKPDGSYDELQTIRNKINELISQIEAMNRDKYESKLLQNKLAIELLNTKINPHILYNSLSAIKLAAFKENSTEIDEMLDELIAYYRLVLNRGEELITVGKELEYLEKYIAVNEMSKKTSYDFDVDVSKEVFDTQIPHMLLQPIVENAIKYGRDTNPCIGIKFYPEGESVVFEISDNGMGMDKEKMEKLNRFEGLGYGIKNVMQRLEFYCGKNYSLKFCSNEMGGTTVVLKMLRLNGEDNES